ncbi:hypothetical protein J2T22_000758 [Pseudarthrobacter defluvii]|uniref:Uncharacterized protein n=1 Tax=Pseudarthrobacter defluvii TaxID=410837 RepID=A0ABT9UD72_9MICC|nr:hypothetical protein [Pseudarthrobacter defluvii]MDQ0117588.1 hypothetical protein [Pseudarthrobacter defluvii]
MTTLSGNAGLESTHHLVCVDSLAVEGTDLADGDKACNLLSQRPNLLEYSPATTDEECEDVGQPNIADVFGEAHGNPVRASYRRDNSCNVDAWDELAAVLGKVQAK